MRRMYSTNQIASIAGAVATEVVEDAMPHLYAYTGDVSDLTLEDATTGVSNYYTIISSETFTKLSDMPDGEYIAISGSVTYDSDDIQISRLTKEDNTYTFYIANDNYILFTISIDNELIKKQIF